MRLSSKKGTLRARQLRRNMSLPEILLWRTLRLRPDGLKFRRQHVLGPFVADFFCDQARLAIEIDGMAHDTGTRPERDIARDAWLNDRSIRTLRVAARDVLNDLEAVTRLIIAECGIGPLHHPASPNGPPPLQGGIA